jgi:hypothetical protein
VHLLSLVAGNCDGDPADDGWFSIGALARFAAVRKGIEVKQDMWPKLFVQLFELLPHVTRLVPIADRYFSSKTANEKANEAALAALAEDVRGDLGQVTKAHAGLYRQLQELSAHVGEVGEDAKRTRLAMEQQGHRLENLESEVVWLARWLKGGFVLMVILLGVVIYLVAQAH